MNRHTKRMTNVAAKLAEPMLSDCDQFCLNVELMTLLSKLTSLRTLRSGIWKLNTTVAWMSA